MKKIYSIINNNIFMLIYIYRLCPRHIYVTLLVSILASLSSVISLFITRYIINTIQSRNNNHGFIVVLGMIILLLIVNLVHTFITNYIQQKIIPKNTLIISRQMQSELFNKAAIIEIKYYDEPAFFDVFSMTLNQAESRAQRVLETFNTLVANLFSIGALIALISVLEPILLLIIIINVGISFWVNTIVTKLQYRFTQEKIQYQREMEYSKFIFYRNEYAKELRLNRKLKDILTYKLINASNKIIILIDDYGKKIFLYSYLQSVLNNLMSSSILLYLAYKVINVGLLIGDFVTLSTSSQQLAMRISELINTFPQMYEHSLYIDNFKKFISYTPPLNYGSGMSITRMNSIKLIDVSFRYPSCKIEVLKNISFEIKQGEKIAIVGENGVGKSTLVKLLVGLYEASNGEIIINDHNINTYELNEFRACISVVFQDYKVFALSIAENILMHGIDGDRRKKDEELVIESLKFVGLYEKIMLLPEGIYTKLTREFNSEGVIFSGGEIQKIALARAYVSNCSLLILDEPSSSLDPIAEYEMLNKMMALSHDKCTIIISHRLKNIKNVDHIYVVNKCSIVEHGTHEKLMERRGLYFDMYNKQTREVDNISTY